MKLTAACAFGLEKPLKWELAKLGFTPKVSSPGRVSFEGDWDDVCKANLWLRIADRVLIEIQSFESPDFEALFETVKAFDWKQWLPADARFPVNGRSRLSQLTSVPAIQRAVKKAIVESMQAGHQTMSLPETGAEFRIEVALLNDVATITLDTTGASLHKRGYRKEFGEAPIKETLAAALVMLSVWNPNRPLIDPFCGSGTIAIEAAMIARNLAPGRNRSFLWEHWPQAADISRNDHLQGTEAVDVQLQIFASDIDESVLDAAQVNAREAGVEGDIQFQQQDFSELSSELEFGCVITNPPYGERLEERHELLPLYGSFPLVLSRLPSWSHFVITNFPSLEGLLRKSATRRRKLFNGRIECMYYQFLGPRPDSNFTAPKTIEAAAAEAAPQVVVPPPQTETSEPASEAGAPKAMAPEAATPKAATPKAETSEAAASETPAMPPASETPNNVWANRKPAKSVWPVFGGLTPKDQEQSQLFSTRLKKRSKHLRRWPTKKGITCYRLYDKDIPELPFVVDRYEDCYHVTEYVRPHERDPGRHAAWLDLMKKTIAETFDTPIEKVFFKTRLRQSGLRQHEKMDHTQDRMVVQENGLKFLVNLQDYVDTGLFLDHRSTRNMVLNQVKGKRFLNLFAYTGSFSVYAAKGDAVTTTTVDWSNTYLKWAQANMVLNGFDSPLHQFVRSDSMEFLQGLDPEQEFDLAVVDPPTFSNSKRTEMVWDVQESHAELLEVLCGNIASEGQVYFSTNFRRFKLDPAIEKLYEVRNISKQTVPEDFRNKRIHQCWLLTRK